MLFSRKGILLPVFFFQKTLATSNNITCLKHLTESVVDKNEEGKVFVIKIENSAFTVCDIHVAIQIASLSVNFKRLHCKN